MADVLANARTWLESQRTSHMTTTVTLRRRGGGASASLPASKDSLTTDQVDEYGRVERVVLATWTFAKSDLVTAGFFEPDQTLEVVAAGVVYRASSPPGVPVWRYEDPSMLSVRISFAIGGVE